jgi:hypothetical protein
MSHDGMLIPGRPAEQLGEHEAERPGRLAGALRSYPIP